MAKDLNPTYRRIAYDNTPVKSKLLYEDLTKSMKEAYVTGKIVTQAKNPYTRPFHNHNRGKRPATFNRFNNRYNNNNNYNNAQFKKPRNK